MENLKYYVSTFLILWSLMILVTFSSIIAFEVLRHVWAHASTPTFVVYIATMAFSAIGIPGLLHLYLKSRWGETRALPPLIAMILFFVANYFYASYWGLLSFEAVARLSRFALVFSIVFALFFILLSGYVYRRRHKKVEDYIAERNVY